MGFELPESFWVEAVSRLSGLARQRPEDVPEAVSAVRDLLARLGSTSLPQGEPVDVVRVVRVGATAVVSLDAEGRLLFPLGGADEPGPARLAAKLLWGLVGEVPGGSDAAMRTLTEAPVVADGLDAVVAAAALGVVSPAGREAYRRLGEQMQSLAVLLVRRAELQVLVDQFDQYAEGHGHPTLAAGRATGYRESGPPADPPPRLRLVSDREG